MEGVRRSCGCSNSGGLGYGGCPPPPGGLQSGGCHNRQKRPLTLTTEYGGDGRWATHPFLPQCIPPAGTRGWLEPRERWVAVRGRPGLTSAGVCSTCSLQGPGWARGLRKTPASGKWQDPLWSRSPALPNFWKFLMKTSCPSPLHVQPLSAQGSSLLPARIVTAGLKG